MSKVVHPILATVRPLGTSTRSPVLCFSQKSRSSLLGKGYRKSVVAALLGLGALTLTQLCLLSSMANPIEPIKAPGIQLQSDRRKCSGFFLSNACDFEVSSTQSLLSVTAPNCQFETYIVHASDYACSYILRLQSTVRLFVRHSRCVQVRVALLRSPAIFAILKTNGWIRLQCGTQLAGVLPTTAGPWNRFGVPAPPSLLPVLAL
jgi:hypothetical protein